jgi:hypothetical protein
MMNQDKEEYIKRASLVVGIVCKYSLVGVLLLISVCIAGAGNIVESYTAETYGPFAGCWLLAAAFCLLNTHFAYIPMYHCHWLSTVCI